MVPTPRKLQMTTLVGVALGLALHVLQPGLRLLFPQSLVYIGLTQWIYLLPAVLLFPALRRGLFVAGALTFVVNAMAYGVMYWLFFVPH
ncbi:MAG TPA: hypothetical protein VNT75_13795 [Symbiobacteriaceae bacterium]|nr:hypothetical protein [Symbiobacteriaceae bacterium]